jgi:hypothetical protein
MINNFQRYKKVIISVTAVFLFLVILLAVYAFSSQGSKNTPVSYTENTPVSYNFKNSDCAVKKYTNLNAHDFSFEYNECDFVLSEEPFTYDDFYGNPLQNYNVKLINEEGFEVTVSLRIALDGYPSYVCLDNMKSEYAYVNDLVRFYNNDTWRYYNLYETVPENWSTEDGFSNFKSQISILSYPIASREQITEDRCYQYSTPATESITQVPTSDRNYMYGVYIDYQNADYSNLVDAIVESMTF